MTVTRMSVRELVARSKAARARRDPADKPRVVRRLDLVRRVAVQTGLPRWLVDDIMEALLATTCEGLTQGVPVSWGDVGAFWVGEARYKKGLLPGTVGPDGHPLRGPVSFKIVRYWKSEAIHKALNPGRREAFLAANPGLSTLRRGTRGV